MRAAGYTTLPELPSRSARCSADVPFLRELTRGRGVFVYMDPPPRSAVHIEHDGMDLILTPVP